MTASRYSRERDIFGCSHGRTKIAAQIQSLALQVRDATRVMAMMQAAAKKNRRTKSLRAHGGYDFLSLFAAPAILESEAIHEGRANVQMSRRRAR